MTLSLQQEAAVAHFRQWRGRRAWLAGYAGSGKTTIVPNIVETIGARRPLLVAPTNKAARVLSMKTGRSVQTIHSAIYYPPNEDPDGRLGWNLNPDGAAAHADLIVCDEASMVGKKLGGDLMSFGVPILAIGDPGQLPPVNDEPYFCTGTPDFMLTEIHRQAADNPIIQLSQDVRAGKQLATGTMGDAVRIVRRGQIEIPDHDIPQIIVGTHKRRWAVTAAVRDVLGYRGWLPEAGEPLLARKNSDQLINGEMMVCERCEEGDGVLDIWADGRTDPYKTWSGHFMEHQTREVAKPEYLSPEWIDMKENECLDFGHAITCHSAQGSQWPEVIVFDESRVFLADAVKWIYTAVTRAAERLTVII